MTARYFVRTLLLLFLPNLAWADVYTIPVLGGEMRLDDWGFAETLGRNALDFDPVNGFGGNAMDPSGRVTLVQHEETQNPDGLTQDPPYDTSGDMFFVPRFPSANMDGTVNFFAWAYTSKAGSNFNRHQVDSDGDHLIPKQEMSFTLYDLFMYHDTTGANRDRDFNTRIRFEPFPMSDARGFCGFPTHPLALEPMGGQVQFDLGIEVYLPGKDLGENDAPDAGEGSFQYIPAFQMRSYGSLEMDVTVFGIEPASFHYVANASANNTDPRLGRDADHPMGFASPDFYNHVSFIGGGVIPRGVWLTPEGAGARGATIHPNQGDPGQRPGQVREDGAVWHVNLFGGMPFLLRADAHRIVDFIDTSRYGELPDLYPELDLDIADFSVTAEAGLGQLVSTPIRMTVAVQNNGSADLAYLPAKVVGTQNGQVVFTESQVVSDHIDNRQSTFRFGPYTPTATGDIQWTVTIDDGNPDDDTATATTSVN